MQLDHRLALFIATFRSFNQEEKTEAVVQLQFLIDIIFSLLFLFWWF